MTSLVKATGKKLLRTSEEQAQNLRNTLIISGLPARQSKNNKTEFESSNTRAMDRRHGHRSHTRSMSPRSNSRDHDRIRDRSHSRSRSRSRRHHRDSRSPAHSSKHDHRRRERRHHHHRQHGGRRDLSPVSAAPPVLPYNVRQLSKRDLPQLEPMFAMYLDIQKGLVLEDLDEDEVKGRWKSFIKKW